MERLTKYICERAHGAEGVSENKLTGSYCRGQFEATALVERLSNIEDILGDTYDLDRLRELVDAEKAGRCMVLPCHVGEQVYYVANVVSPGYPDPVTKPEIFLRPFKIEWIYGIGKFVFLTREAAESALAKETDHE